MNKANKEMLDEYDFTKKKGVRGKYYDAFKKGYSVRVYKDDGTFAEEYFASIEADVHKHFPNSEAVNNALRSLITNQSAKQ
jgi:hypothetical protein